MSDLGALRSEFALRFGGEPTFFQAPGRVNLIGEHTDYNGGFVMPVAIGFFTTVAIRPRAGKTLRVHSINVAETIEIDVETLLTAPLPRPGPPHWSNYVAGVARALASYGVLLQGADLLIASDVPIGAGLSSSAALEVACAIALMETSGASIDRQVLALLCQQAENEFVGMRCGFMDQIASACARARHAMLLDCLSIQHRLLPLDAKGEGNGHGDSFRVVICNTTVRHQHAGGEYNRRREQCEQGVKYLNQVAGNVKTLRDVSMEMLHLHGLGMDEVTYRRCRHVVEENARVGRAAQALTQSDLGRFGLQMHDSHNSLRNDYEVSCEELDLMVRAAGDIDGVYGARMTGGGFGGCTVNLVRTDAVERFEALMGERYEKATGIRPEIYVCNSVDGAARVELE